MKKTAISVLSVFVITGLCFAQTNVKTFDKSKAPKHYGEMMIRNTSAADKLKQELESKHMTIEEYADYVFEKSNKYFQEKYPQFAHTCIDVEDLIKKELFKNPNWKIKEIISRGQNPLITSESTYLIKSTSGDKEVVCYGSGRDDMDNAIYMWKNPADFEKCEILYNNVRKPLAGTIKNYVKSFTGSDKNSIDREFSTIFYSRKQVCSYTLSYCEPPNEYKTVWLGKDKPLYPFHKCDKGEYFPIKNLVVKMEEGNDKNAYSFINLYSCFAQTSPKTIYYAENPKTATDETIVKEVPMQFKKLKEYKVNDYLSKYNIKCEDLKEEVFACATRLGPVPANKR